MASQGRVFKCSYEDNDFIKVKREEGNNIVTVEGVYDGRYIKYYFSITTAIKLAKTIRTEINKAKGI